jgi:hypothetical protein
MKVNNMNIKPVAWMQHHYETEKITKFSPVKVWEDDIPLYTHPAKTLTDEEMYELLEKYQGIELCKAVLRKAQKK